MTNEERSKLLKSLYSEGRSVYVNTSGLRFTLDTDPMTGCISYRCDEAELNVYCTPDWETPDLCICVSVSDDDGRCLYSDDHAWPTFVRSGATFFALVQPHLDRVTA